MTSARQTAFDLLRRLLAGEREQVPLQLALLLERSFPLHSSDDFYRAVLPPELAELQLLPDSAWEIISTLCSEVSRSPDEALIAAISFTGADLPTKTVTKVLTNPPRPLTMGEFDAALSLVGKFLPYSLAQDSNFVPKAELERIVQLAEELQNVEEVGTGADRSARIGVRHHSAQLLESLRRYGIIES
jgi:hypothetical protein